MWRNTMPRGLRLSVAAVGALVLVGAPTATAAPSDGANEVTTTAAPTTTTTAAAATTTAAPTTTRERYVSRGDSEEATATTTTTTTTTPAPATTVAPTTSAPAPTTPVGNRAMAAAAGRAGLSITVAGQWATVVPGAKSANGTLTLITVRDDSSGTRGWVATASSTDFVGTNGTIPKSAVNYRATALGGELAGGDLSSKGWQSLEAPKTVVERTGLSWPLEMITWTPALTVNYPDGAAIGAYSGTITISVA
ncbi:hypothetical protein GS894_22480 [Rhodococcus hoagii]|uniref:Secreted protein n=1 Tax=Rhodococcus hoagii (strain 103S) TaxID=685727 RepID=A0A3S5Y164_RHOH1|nr:hypothetical protein [Prescottella equi]CBH46268.1 putative secreted protein [Prescottella equi 103S]GBF16462.1 hypothetical protein Br6_03855 [Rhodococcus sp. Br-6]MBM4600956.1 hypothetical protein [Prescottella equi]NKR66377.1 hypothetical protein [Prescottella equi]